MLDLAISIDTDRFGTTIAETNRGKAVKAPGWPQDSDFNLLAFTESSSTADVVSTERLVKDIALAVRALRDFDVLKGKTPDWYKRLEKYAFGADGL